MPLSYAIDVTRAQLRELLVTLDLAVADCAADLAVGGHGLQRTTTEIVLFLPSWTPGSYLIREYVRHLSRVQAHDAETGTALTCQKVSKNRFRVVAAATTRRVRVSYRVYAHELSVRTADLTGEHAYWNHACLLLWPVDRPGLTAEIRITHGPEWAVACALPTTKPAAPSGNGSAFVTTLTARDLDQAMDSPCLVGRFQRLEWDVAGVPHAIVLDGLGAVVPPPSLVTDLGRIVARAAAVFGGSLPYANYLFLCLFTADGHGGLEHADSTTLLSSRTALANPKGYREFLGLAAHELFHAWNVKRMRPAEFWHYDYENENYTEFLWLIEGWTAYYDDLLCLRAGLMSRTDYLGLVGKSMHAMLTGPGRRQLSLAESSFDAWIRLYRPDENTRNSSQNYYVNGSVVALSLDLLLRRETDGAHSLDDVIRELYRRSFAAGRGYTMADVLDVVRQISNAKVADVLPQLVAASLEPDLADLTAAFGLRLSLRDADRPHLGLTFEANSTKVAAVTAASPAYDAGVAPGDEVLALQGLRVLSSNWQDVFQAIARIGERLELLLARRGVVMSCVAIPSATGGTWSLEVADAATAQQSALRDAWLRQDLEPAASQAT